MNLLARQRACSLVVVLMLLLGAITTGSPVAPRCQCPPQCPMHAHGLTCHHGGNLLCHQTDGGAGIRSGCGHAPDHAAPVSSIRWVLPVRAAARPSLARSFLTPMAFSVETQPFPEPPTHPPRLHVA